MTSFFYPLISLQVLYTLLSVAAIPDVPPINSTESTPNFLYNYSNVDLQPQEAFLNVPCSFVYKLSSDMWSNVTAMWRRENGGMISSNRSDQLHQILGQGQANLSISVSALKNYEGPYKCIATSKYYNHSVLLKRAKIVFSPLATTSPDGKAVVTLLSVCLFVCKMEETVSCSQ